jgi:adenylate cyclase
VAHGFNVEEDWRILLEKGITPQGKRLRRWYAMLPTKTRCRICLVPFSGFTGQIMRTFGKIPSNLNPYWCNECETFARTHLGGIETRFSMFFADIRGSTSLAEHMQPAEFKRLIDRFYATATAVLARTDAIIDKLAGDQVSGYYFAGMVGPGYPRVAVESAQELLRVTGHGSPAGPWIPVGVGVHTGYAFYGSVGAPGGVVDVTALGDAVNIAARLASNAGPGEILITQETYTDAGLDRGDLERRELTLKGRTQPVSVYVLK